MLEYGRVWTDADEWDYQDFDSLYRQRQQEADEYAWAVYNGLCPRCEGHNTSDTYKSGVVDARWCYDCDEEFVTEY